MSFNRNIYPVSRVRWALWVLPPATVFIAVILGVWTPGHWQLPLVIIVGSIVVSLIGIIALRMLRSHNAKLTRIARNVAEIRADNARLSSTIHTLMHDVEGRSQQSVEALSGLVQRAGKDEMRMRQIGQLALRAAEGASRLEARAHNDEMRMRHVGQLAKKAAEAGEKVSKLYETAQNGIQGSGRAEARPATSAVKVLSTNKAIGRLAAAVGDDRERAEKLHQALDFATSREKNGLSSVAVIGTSRLACYLTERGTVSSALMPGYSVTQLIATPAPVLVIEERAFLNGPWFGADSPQGSRQFDEIRELCGEALSRGIAVYVVRALGQSNIYSKSIRDLGYVFPSTEFEEPWAIGAELGLMQDLQEYATREWNEQ